MRISAIVAAVSAVGMNARVSRAECKLITHTHICFWPLPPAAAPFGAVGGWCSNKRTPYRDPAAFLILAISRPRCFSFNNQPAFSRAQSVVLHAPCAITSFNWMGAFPLAPQHLSVWLLYPCCVVVEQVLDRRVWTALSLLPFAVPAIFARASALLIDCSFFCAAFVVSCSLKWPDDSVVCESTLKSGYIIKRRQV